MGEDDGLGARGGFPPDLEIALVDQLRCLFNLDFGDSGGGLYLLHI